MKLFKKLMAGVMAIAMLSAYTVALADDTFDPSTESGGSKTATVSGAGRYAGDINPVFVMTLPTAASVANSLAFTVDPQRLLERSKPANAISAASGGSDDFGTVVFSTQSGDATPNMIYRNQSEPLKVISKSSVDVTVNMLATLSDSKMKLFDGATFNVGSGFAADNKTDYLYLGVKVDTRSGTARSIVSGAVVVSGGTAVSSTKTISPLGAKEATVLKAVSENFEATSTGFATISGGPTLNNDSWNYAEYTVMGASNPNADWAIEGLTAPNLTIKWVIDPANKVTYSYGTLPTGNYTVQFDKDEYKAGEIATVFVRPNNEEERLSSVALNYIAINTTTGKTSDERSVGGSVVSTPINGVYSATITWPSDMARSTSPVGDSAYRDPLWEIEVG